MLANFDNAADLDELRKTPSGHRDSLVVRTVSLSCICMEQGDQMHILLLGTSNVHCACCVNGSAGTMGSPS